MRALQYRDEFSVVEAPAPARLAPFGYAQTVDIDLDGEPIGSGRLVILHDPVGQPAWEGAIRIVAYVDADVDLAVAADPMLPEVGWSWLLEAFEECDLVAHALGGTVTQVGSRSFGVLDDRDAEGRLQVRASWTAAEGDSLAAHARVWALLAASACGLDPAATGSSSVARLGKLR